MLGDSAYTAVLWLNRYFNIMRRRLGYQYWSLSAYLKHRVKNATQYIGSFADAVATEATRRGVDGVVCGHIHWIEHWMPDPLRRHIDDEPEIDVQAQLPEQFLSHVVPVHRPSGNHFYAERARYAGLV